jgi:hypothetical protein
VQYVKNLLLQRWHRQRARLNALVYKTYDDIRGRSAPERKESKC